MRHSIITQNLSIIASPLEGREGGREGGRRGNRKEGGREGERKVLSVTVAIMSLGIVALLSSL